MSELIKPKVLLIVEDDPEQLKALEKQYGCCLGLTAYENFETGKSPSTAYTNYFSAEGSASFEGKEEIRKNITERHQDQIRHGARLVTMARTFREFKSEFDLGLDGVILDMHFPLTYDKPWDKPQPLGVRAGLKLEEAGIPFVINTAWNHHGADSQWVYEMVTERDWPMIETSKDAIKDWKESIGYVLKEMGKSKK